MCILFFPIFAMPRSATLLHVPKSAAAGAAPDDEAAPNEAAALPAGPAQAPGEADAQEAAPAKKGRGRPKGCSFASRIKTTKFDIEEGVQECTDLASNTYHPDWDWDGQSYPKTKRSHGPHIASLNDHCKGPQKPIIRLAPRCYPDPYKLKDLLLMLHDLFQSIGVRGSTTCR